jgi:hypothetical protein
MRQKVPEPFRSAMDITALDYFDCQFYGSIAWQYVRQAMLLSARWRLPLAGLRMCVLAPQVVRSIAQDPGLEALTRRLRGSVSERSASILFPQKAELVDRWTTIRGADVVAYLGGCSPGLFAHLSMFSAAFSWLGRIGGLGSLGWRGNRVSLSIWYLPPPRFTPRS